MEEAMIRVENLTHIYNQGSEGERIALRDVNLTIPKGQFAVIIGHNGSGKSTLAKHFNALLQPTHGKVYVKNMDTQNPEHLWEIRRLVGMVFQNPDNQIVATIVEEDIAFGPENLGVPPSEIRRRVDWAMRAVGIEKFSRHAPHLLSGGQKQRVAIAGVLAMASECIVLDEPTAMLDPAGREEVLQTIKKLNEQNGVTVVHVTHYMEEAVNADRIIVMDAGQVVMDGKPREVFSQVDKLKKIGLTVPQVTDLADQLIKAGLPLQNNILTIEELVKQLC